MLFDTHMHAEYSCDAHMKITEAIAAAREQNLGMILTEHWDRFYPTNPEMFMFDLKDYFAQNSKYRSEDVLLGIEIGMQPAAALEDEKLVQEYPFDEVIASMHCFVGKDMYEPTSYVGLTKDVAVKTYLEESIKCLDLYDDFDSYGHIDYICRYMPYEDQNLYYKEHPVLWDAVFRRLIEGHKALEINTRRLSDAQALPSLRELYQRYKELGGQYVTLGSDAHYKEHVGRDFAIARQMAKALGLAIVHFSARKMQVDEV